MLDLTVIYFHGKLMKQLMLTVCFDGNFHCFDCLTSTIYYGGGVNEGQSWLGSCPTNGRESWQMALNYHHHTQMGKDSVLNIFRVETTLVHAANQETALGDASIFPNRLISSSLQSLKKWFYNFRFASSHKSKCNILLIWPTGWALNQLLWDIFADNFKYSVRISQG